MKETLIILASIIITLVIAFICIIPLNKHYHTMSYELNKTKTELSQMKIDRETLINEIKTEHANAELPILVDYIKSIATNLPDEMVNKTAKALVVGANKWDIPFPIVIGLAQRESTFNTTAVSSCGARGLLQVMYKIWSDELNIETPKKLHIPKFGVDYGLSILTTYLESCDDNISKALFKYNGSATIESKAFTRDVFEYAAKYSIFKTNYLIGLEREKEEQNLQSKQQVAKNEEK